MVIPRLRHDAREDWDDDDDWSDDDMTESSTPHPSPTSPLEEDPSASDYYTIPSDMQTHQGPFGPEQTGNPYHTKYGPPNGLTTQTYSSDHSALSEQNGSTASPKPTQVVAPENGPGHTTASSEGFGRSHGNDYGEKSHSSRGAIYAVAGIVPVVVIAIIGVFIFFYLRKRKRQRMQSASAQERMQQMKMANQPFVAAHYNSAVPPPPSVSLSMSSPPPSRHQYVAAPSHPPPPANPPPIILGPIESASNGAYFTGIDTSDVVSVNDRTGLGDPFADGNSLNEEPPPPYRPRSLAPLSRDTSLRAPPTAATQSQINLIGNQHQDLRSPFADPHDDDAVSEVSSPTVRRDQDAMSAVSDLSYQQDPVVARRAV